MQIKIKTLTGRLTALTFEDTATLRDVKASLQEKEGIQVEQIRLIFQGKQPTDDKTLVEVGIKPGDTLHMVLQLRGGSR